ncbi:MAG: cytochrome c [Bacteroidetes bacterium]|nr:MAG: cytochrome c [Bacteroidota bacterium]
MPWIFYSGMTDEDLKAIYAYLKSIPPIQNKVKKFEIQTASTSEKK